MDVGIRELRNNLSRYLDRVKAGETVTITEHGRPIARVEGIRSGHRTLDEMIALGLARAPLAPKSSFDDYRPVKAIGSVSELVREQRR
jgi:prevent-host-death family protein